MTTDTAPKPRIPSLQVRYPASGRSKKNDELGMRPMQARAYAQRGEPYLLIKSPPASGKSRALMFIALDKLTHQGIKQALILVPERSIGASFNSTPLSDFGFEQDWVVAPEWNLCDATGTDQGKVKAIGRFLESDARIIIMTHASFRFAFEAYGVEAFDGRLLAIDEFHHTSANPDNVLGRQLGELLDRDKVHVIAMTGSYFRGDAEPILMPEDEARFTTVTYTYYEQLSGYDYLRELNLGYYFYSGSYLDEISEVLDPDEKTIIHIPSVNSRESTKDKIREVEALMESLGTWVGTDPETGFHQLKRPDGQTLKIADLVDDEPLRRAKVQAALAAPKGRADRDHVDIIIALGMAKEGFDWIWCEHALTIGYRSSLTEIVQIIGRTTRDAPGKVRARFTNLIAEPDTSEQLVSEAVNDTLKAISASLLMQAVLTPKMDFKPKFAHSGPVEGLDYGEAGYQKDRCNIGERPDGSLQIEISGLPEMPTERSRQIVESDMPELIAQVFQDQETMERGLFDRHVTATELTHTQFGKVIRDRYPHESPEEQEALRLYLVAHMGIRAIANSAGVAEGTATYGDPGDLNHGGASDRHPAEPHAPNTAFVDSVRRYVLDVRDLEIDLIERTNPFGEAYAIISQTLDEQKLRAIENLIGAKKYKIDPQEALELIQRAAAWKNERGHDPRADSPNWYEQQLARGVTAFFSYREQGLYDHLEQGHGGTK